jgi:hypothetical protein
MFQLICSAFLVGPSDVKHSAVPGARAIFREQLFAALPVDLRELEMNQRNGHFACAQRSFYFGFGAAAMEFLGRASERLANVVRVVIHAAQNRKKSLRLQLVNTRYDEFLLWPATACRIAIGRVGRREIGGAEGDRTPDLRNAIATLSQLSYGPTPSRP